MNTLEKLEVALASKATNSYLIKERIIDIQVDQTEVLPIQFNPKYITNSLRQSNYDTESALSELVDNSIDAESNVINISIPSKNDLQSGKKAILIYDDGIGMNLEQLKESFSFGSNRQYSVDDIGNYGIGMKAAMAYLSQYVLLETKHENSNIVNIAIWDIDNDPLNIRFFQEENDDETFISGTRIQMYCKWGESKHSRLEHFSHTQPAYVIKKFAARYFNALNKMKTSPEGNSLPKLDININGLSIIPFDPLYRNDKNVKNNNQDVRINVNDIEHYIKIDGYYLGYTEPNGFDKKIPTKINPRGSGFSLDDQGVYLLLNNKYIQIGGNWLGCRQAQHYLNTTRVEVEIPKELIEYFGISMNKNSIINLKLNSEETSLTNHSEKQIIIDAITSIGKWGEKLVSQQREQQKVNISEDNNKIAEELTKQLNKKVKEIGLKKPSKGLEKLPSSSKETTEPKGGTKDRPDGLKYNDDIFKIDFFEGNKNDNFWRLDREGRKTVISFNSSHVFYDKYINNENSGIMLEFLCAMAQSELNSYLRGHEYDEWEKFWHEVSGWISTFSKEQID